MWERVGPWQHDPLGARGSSHLRGSAAQRTVGVEWGPSEHLRRVLRFSLQAQQVPALASFHFPQPR